MHVQSVIKRLSPDGQGLAARYAIVDCAATEADNTIYSKLISDDIEKYQLFTGEMTRTIDHVVPFLVPLHNQPELESRLLETGWGSNWGIFFAAGADIEVLLDHFREYFKLQAPNGRDIFFRFYDAWILRDFLATLSQQETLAFFGPVQRFVVESSNGDPMVFEHPEGEPVESIEPSKVVLNDDKRAALSKDWQTRMLEQHTEAYQNQGVKVTPEPNANALTIEDKAGAIARMQKTAAGVDVTTGEQRKFQYALTPCEHPAAVIDPAGNRIDFDIQERHNKEKNNAPPLVKAIRMDGGETTWVFDYDEMHHLERVGYPDGTSAEISHDSYGNLIGWTDRNGNATQYEYDFDERLTQFKNANGRATCFEYEDITAPASISFADGAAFGFEYTDAGTLEKFLADNTLVARYQVDQERGSWKVDYLNGEQAEFVVKDGKIVRATNAVGTVTLDYDDAGHLIKETFQNRSVVYHRNPSGQLIGITTPFDQRIEYRRDGEQRVCGIKGWSDGEIAIQYALNGALEKMTYPNGTSLEQQTNAQGLPTEMHLRGPQGTLFSKTFQRDPLNRITQISEDEEHLSFHYDKEGRLLDAQSSDGTISETFTVDANANRRADYNTRYVINESDRLVQAGMIPSEYDSLGNLTEGTCPRGRADYAYTDLNRLKSITLKSNHAKYIYDAFGRRVGKKVNGTTTRYYWAQSQLLHEANIKKNGDSKAVEIIDYLFFPETPVLLAIRQNRQIRWAAFGHRYEVLCLSDESGNLVWQAQYDAFGRAHIEMGEDLHQPFRLAGQYFDKESGLHYNLARYYDPSQGRFLTPDPLFLEGGNSNFYAYCDGDPINHIDPSGEFIFTAILIGAAVGAAIGGKIEAMRQNRSGKETGGFKIAKAALIGGAIGAIGGGCGSAVEVAAGAGALGSAMAGVGFLSGAGASVAEQCAEAQMADNGINPLTMVQQALADGLIGAGTSLVTFGADGFAARRLRKASGLSKPAKQTERTADLVRKARSQKAEISPQAKQKGLRKSDKSELCKEGDSVNAVTGEVMLAQTDFTLPGRMPLTWTRHYGSQNDYAGLLGPGWQTPADARLEIDNDEMVTFCDGSPGGAVFEKLPIDAPVMEAADGGLLSATEKHYQVRLNSGLTYHFSKTFSDNQSLVTRIGDPSGNYLAFERDQGNLTHIRDNSGQCIEVTSRHGHIAAMQINARLLVSYHYDSGHLIAAEDARGGQTRFYCQGWRLIRYMDKNKVAFDYDYDLGGCCVHAWGDNGLYDYRFDHESYERSVVVTDSLGHQKTYFYDKDRLPVKEQDHTGAAVGYAYDEVGRIVNVTDPLDRTTEYDYDAAGNVLQIIRPGGNNTAFTYDDDHRLIQVVDANGKPWEQRYDDQGRLIEIISPLDERIQYSYSTSGDPITMTDAQGRVTTFEYDDHGLVSAVTDNQNHTTRFQRDLLGSITAVIDPAGGTTRYVYDKTQRLIQTLQPSGIVQHFAWDGEDNLVQHTDPNGQQTRLEYGGVNEIVRHINADGTSVTYQYDSEENLTGVTNEKGQTHQFQYDHAGRVTAQTDYYGHTTRYSYDPAGQLVESCDPLERTIAYDYDPAGRLLAKTFENEETAYFNWDANSNLTAIQSPDAMLERSYDAANRLIAEKKGAFTVAYQYDTSGRRTGRTTSHGNNVQYSYDESGALSAIQINDQAPVAIKRNALGQITSEHFSDHLTRDFEYNEDGLLSRQSINGAGTTIERSYTYDAAGNLTAKNDSAKGPWQYTYDPMSRITEALDPEHQVHRFGLDSVGDLLEHLPDTGHSLRSAKYNNTEYRFDAAGNLTERQTEEELTRFDWDEHNRLKTVRKADNTRITMAYDALGRRHTKAVNGERTFFHWDGDALLCAQFEDEAPREYVYYPGTFEPLALIDGDGQVYYYHNDLSGLPAELTKPNGDIAWSACYDALGRVEQILVDEVEQPLRMQGQYYDEETGLFYNRYRYFDPQICSFISQDPLGLAAGENLYAYTPNVWGWVDPLGLACKATAENAIADPARLLPVPNNVRRSYGDALQDNAAKALALRNQVNKGPSVFCAGNFSRSTATGGQFWSPSNLLTTPGYATKVGAGNLGRGTLDFVIGGRVKPGSNFIARPAPAIGSNAGGDLKMATPHNGVQVDFFHML